MLTELVIVYKRKEIATRISILFSANILATAFQGLIAAPIYSELGGTRGLSGWRWMYLIMGAWSLFFSVVGLFFFPNKPTTTWWLTPAQKTLAADRIAADTVGKKEDVNLLKGLRECLRDRRVWAFMAAQHLQTATSSFRIFLPTLIDTLGFSRTVTLVLTCPPYILAGISSILGGLSSGRFNERTWHITIIKLISILGFVLACATLNTGARYFAAFVFVAATYPASPLILSWTGITCGQTSEKRAASLAAVNTLSSLSLIWTPVRDCEIVSGCRLSNSDVKSTDGLNSIYGPTPRRLAMCCPWLRARECALPPLLSVGTSGGIL